MALSTTQQALSEPVRTFRQAMPGMLRHEGIWRGVYRHFGPDATLIETHDAQVECEFPPNGPYVYVQHNRFTWANGATKKATLPATFRGGKLWWDVGAFSGWGWESAFGLILLNLTRKDDPGANFFEMITLSETGQHRARTWHWFKDGALIRRTHCDETLIDRP